MASSNSRKDPPPGSFYQQLCPLQPKPPASSSSKVRFMCHSPTHHFQWSSLACKEETQSPCPAPSACNVIFFDKLPGSLILSKPVCPLNLFCAFLQYAGYCLWQVIQVVLISYGCWNKLPQMWWLTMTEFIFSQFWKPSLKSVSLSWSQVLPGPCSYGGSRREFVLASSSLWWLPALTGL